MAYIPSSGSIVSFQSDPTKLLTHSSVSGNVNVSGSVFATGSIATLQGTNPWVVQLTSGSIVTSGGTTGNSSVMLTPGINTIGSVATLQGTNPWMVQLTSGSIATTAGTTGNSSVQLVAGTAMTGSVTAYQGATPWVITGSIQGGGGTQYVEDTAQTSTTGTAILFRKNDSTSIMGVISPTNPLPIIGSITAFQGAQNLRTVTSISGGISSVGQVGQWNMAPASVQLMAGINTVGSVAALQSTNPWIVQLTSGSVITTGGNSSVMLTPGINTIGSVAALQSTNPWIVQLTSGSVITTGGNSSVMLMPGQNAIGSVTALQGTNPWIITGSVQAAITPAANQSVSGEVNVVQTTNPWIITGSVQASLSPAANQSVSGTVGASIIGLPYFAVAGSVATVGTTANQSVSGTVGTSMIGTVPVTQSGIWATSIVGVPQPHSVSGVGVFNIAGSVSATGSITALQGTNPWVITGSIQGGGGGTQYVEDTAQTSITATAILFRKSNTTSIMSAVSPATPFPTVGSVSGTVNINPASVQLLGSSNVIGSVATYQGTNPWMVGNSSVMLTPGINTVGSIAALQATNPWIVTGSVQGTFTSGNSSVQLVGGTAMTGSVTAYQGVTPWVITGSIQGGGGGTQYVEDTAQTSTTGTVILFRKNDSTSIMGVVSPANPLPVLGSVATLQGTNPWVVGNSSVMLMPSGNSIGSVTALQGTSPWRTITSISGGVTSVSQVGNWNMGPASVQLMAGTNNQGSVTAIQGTNPWAMNHSGNGSIITLSIGSVATVFNAASLISGHASTVGTGSSSVLVLASVQATLYAYITDFLLSNTGAATTLVTFTDSDGSIMGKSIAPTGGGAVATAITSPMRTLSPGKAVYVGAATATSTLHAWVGGYKGL